MSVAAFSIKNRVLVNLIVMAAIVVGAYVTINMRREAMPPIEIDYVFVRTIYPGASPQEVEKLVTIPIEDKLLNIDGIDMFNSASREGVSFVFIELEPDLPKRDKVINDIAREVDKSDLPDDAEDPEVEEMVIEHQLIEISFAGRDVPEEELREYVRNFEEIIKNFKGMGSIDRVGWRDKEVSIEIDPENLDKYYISLAQVINAIQNQNLNLPGGKIKSGTKELILRTVGEIEDAAGFEDIIIRTNTEGKYLEVGDVGRASETFKEQETIYKTNGEVSINLIPKKKKTGDTIKLVDQIKAEVERYEKELPDNVTIALVNDMAFYVKRRLNVLISNGTIGLALLIITLLIFLNSRIALVTALGIPFAFLTALILMSFFDVGLNLITMFGLIMVLGMIVDDAIVVSENVYRYMEEGYDKQEAVIKGVGEVAAPVIATIITTAAAFAPLLFISGIMGKFLRFFPMGVIFCLAASLFEALIVLPVHLYDWVKPLKSKEESEQSAGECRSASPLFIKFICLPYTIIKTLVIYVFSSERRGSEARWFKKLMSLYGGMLSYSIRHRYKMGFLALLVLIGSVIFSVKVMPFKLFPGMIEVFYIRIETPEGTSLEGTNTVLEQIESAALELPGVELENITGTVGYSGEIGGGPFDKHGSQYGQCVVYLTPQKNRKRDADSIINALRDRVNALDIANLVSLQFEKIQQGPPVGKPVSVEIRGDEYPVLVKIRDEIMIFMDTLDGVEDIKDSHELDKEEIRIKIDKKEAARLGLNVRQIANTIRYAFEGGVATSMRKKSEDIDVVVRLTEEYRNDIDTLNNLTIPNSSGRLIKLNKVAGFVKDQGIRMLNHTEGKRTVTVTASIDENKTTAIEANRKIIKNFNDIPLRFPGYYIKIGGEWEDTTESVTSLLRAFVVAFLLIYIVLATLFRSYVQPLIIMTSVPFGLVGVIFALYFHGQPISIMAMFGVVGLTGVVVNDSLILVDFINKRIKSGMPALDAVEQAGRMRLRPILLTSITTIIALLPLIYGIGGEEPFLVPSAIAMAYGLLAATFLTLIIVPCVYLIVNDINVKIASRRNV